MYFREKKSNSGTVLQLLESYRNELAQPRQRVVVSLGTPDIPIQDRPVIAKAVERQLYGHKSFLPNQYSKSTQEWIDRIVSRVDRQGRWHPFKHQSRHEGDETPVAQDIDGVLIDSVEHCNTAELGPELLGLHAWNKLGMPELLKSLGFNGVQRHSAALSVINRLVDPVSENMLDMWVRQTALPEILSEDILSKGKDKFYRISDRLLRHQDEIECHLREAQGNHFNPDRTILLYDLTNTHFEGDCESNPKAKRGNNKQKRSDCPQVTIGMVFDRDGFELTHRVFEGNKNDSTSLVEMVSVLENVLKRSRSPLLDSVSRPLVVIDGGIATKKNLAMLRKSGFGYLVNDSRRGRSTYKSQFAENDLFNVVEGRQKRVPVSVRLLEESTYKPKDTGHDRKLDYKEYIVLCKSEGRRNKEQAILSNAEKRFLEALSKLKERVAKGRLKDRAKIQRGIGRIQAQNQRIQRYYEVKIKKDLQGSLSLEYVRKDADVQEAESLFGCYVLRTDQLELSADDIWRLYMVLTKAEEGFKMLKSELGLRPNRHHLEGRVDGHVFITVLAYQMLSFILKTLEKSGDNRSWGTIRRILQTHSYATMILPTKQGITYRLRKAGVPEESQKAIYHQFGIDWQNLPKSRAVIEMKPTRM